MDFLATKGLEYLLVLAYLLLLIPFSLMLFGRPRRVAPTAPRLAPVAAMRPWFSVPERLHYHRGHTWAKPLGEGVFRVGIDDFAQRLLGAPKALRLPAAGARVEQGAPGWAIQVDGEALDVLSPVGGEVVAANPDALQNPALVCDDPYGRGWLLDVRVPRPDVAVANLLSGNVAQAWMDDASENLSRLMGPPLGRVVQDGGIPVAGFARELAGDQWPQLARALLSAAPGHMDEAPG